jgi:hypothetical protein
MKLTNHNAILTLSNIKLVMELDNCRAVAALDGSQPLHSAYSIALIDATIEQVIVLDEDY